MIDNRWTVLIYSSAQAGGAAGPLWQGKGGQHVAEGEGVTRFCGAGDQNRVVEEPDVAAILREQRQRQ